MAYQPLYATVSDNQGYVRGTSSLRGRVNSIGFWLNSYFGTVMQVSSIYREPCRPEISRKGRTLQEYRLLKKEIEEELDRQRKVIIDIDLEPSERFEFRINGIALPNVQVKTLQNLSLARMDMQLETLKALMRRKETVIAKVR